MTLGGLDRWPRTCAVSGTDSRPDRVTGYPDGSFRPAAPVTRQALAAYLYRLGGRPFGDHPSCFGPAPFTDVPASSPFCGEIAWLKAAHYTTGYPDGTFRPTASVTRDATAALLYRWKNRTSGVPTPCVLQPFTDVAVDSPFCGHIAWMKEHHVTNGYPDGTYHPRRTVDRQTIAAFLSRTEAFTTF